MKQIREQAPVPTAHPYYNFDARSAKILARSFFRELKGNGYSHEQILALSTELIGLVTSDIGSNTPS